MYIIGISAIAPGQGERYRFPLLMFMLPVGVWNVQALQRYLNGVASERLPQKSSQYIDT
jgi:hypothetical protein